MLRLDSPTSGHEELFGADAARLLEAAHALAASRELARVMEVVRKAARDLTRADGVTFVLREGDRVFYADEDAIAPLWKGRRFPSEACISGWSMVHRMSVVVEDIYLDERIPQEAYRPTFVKSLAMVPVGLEDPVAAIGAYWAHRHRATAREVQVLEILAGFAALALANEALVRELREAVAAREDFISIAAHELRTPLSALALTLDSAARPGARSPADALERLRTGVARGRRHVDRLSSLVNTLLDASRMVSGRVPLTLERVDLAGVAADVVARSGRNAGELVLRADGPVVGDWDPVRIERIVENLVSNALKFGRGAPVEVEVSREGGDARLVVTDRGIGIPDDALARIFEKFERAVSIRNFGGFGLGLWIVRRNVEAHGGTIRVESALGAGSRFTVLLPIAA